MAKVKKDAFVAGLSMILVGVIIATTGVDYKHGMPVEKWIGWIFGLYGIYIVYYSISKK